MMQITFCVPLFSVLFFFQNNYMYILYVNRFGGPYRVGNGIIADERIVVTEERLPEHRLDTHRRSQAQLVQPTGK